MFARKLVVKEDDVIFLQIPNYIIIHHDKTCSGHGGLIIYLHKNYSWQIRQLHEQSGTWEGLFIDIYGDNLSKHITLGNIPDRLNVTIITTLYTHSSMNELL